MTDRFARSALLCAVAIALASCSGEIEPEVITQQFLYDVSPTGYAGASDTYINESAPTTAYNGSSNVFAGNYFGNCSTLWRSDLTYLPIDATVVSAELDLYISTKPTADIRLKLMSVLGPIWGEATTYNGLFTNAYFALGASAGSATVLNGASGYLRIPLDAAVVQTWVSEPYGNQGLLIQEDASAGASGTYVGFGSWHQPNSPFRPRLVVKYTL
jgi:hypothetical protein